MARGFAFSFHAGLVLAAFTFVYLMTMLVSIDRWFGLASTLGMFNAVFYTSLAILCAASYRLAMLTDPGRVPASFLPNTEDSEATIREIKRKGGEVRFCQKCSQHKPSRTHHCQICNRCVLLMILGPTIFDWICPRPNLSAPAFIFRQSMMTSSKRTLQNKPRTPPQSTHLEFLR